MLCVDVTGCNVFAHSHAAAAFGHVIALHEHAAGPGDPATAPDPIDPAIRALGKGKAHKFKNFVAAATEHLSPHLDFSFTAFEFSFSGILGPGDEKTIAFLKKARAAKFKADPAPGTGATLRYTVAAFEANLRDNVAVAIARGHARMLRAVGRPSRSQSSLARNRAPAARGIRLVGG